MSENGIYTLRDHRPGDIGWIISRHGQIYTQEYNWNGLIEANVCKACADFIENFNPLKERCWIAECDGRRLGSIILAMDRQSKGTAKLGFLIVEQDARGRGVGRVLIQECIRFAREKGYKRIQLRTYSVLIGARRLYKDAGFVMTKEEEHSIYGAGLVREYWQLTLLDEDKE